VAVTPEPAPDDLVNRVVDWYVEHHRELPWRATDRTPWGVLVSEVMLQQTPVARVLPAWTAWMARWPAPADLASAPPGEAVRQWDRLGYPRRALNLHAAAQLIVERHGGLVPEDEVDLRALPGVGEYTAAAVRAFAFGRRTVVLDTNVRRVLARVAAGTEHPAPALSAAERERAAALVPADDAGAALWSVAVMELGALVCTAASPRCGACPVESACAWVRAGRPGYGGPPRRVQRFAGTDRQVRGRLMAVLRAESDPVPRSALEDAWSVDPVQRERALDGLVADGLVEPLPGEFFRLPGARSGQPSAQR
jgi:A/G-specific adenine glycosylase